MMNPREEFEKMIAQQIEERAVRQKPKSLASVLIKKETRERGTKTDPRAERARKISELADMQLEQCKKKLSAEDVERYNYEVSIISVIVLNLSRQIYQGLEPVRPNVMSVEKLRLATEGQTAYFERSMRIAFGVIYYLCERWMNDGLVKHIEVLHNAYLNEILNQTFRTIKYDANSFIAWVYTTRDIILRIYDYNKMMQDRLIKICANDGEAPVFDEVTMNKFVLRDVYRALGLVIKSMRLPSKIDSQNIKLANDILLNQFKIATIKTYSDQYFQLKNLEGKTKVIA